MPSEAHKKFMAATVATQNAKSKTYSLALLTVLGVCLFGIIVANGSLTRISARNRVVESPDSAKSASFRWHPELYRLLSFGHVPSAVDWLLIRFLLDSNLVKVKNDQETETFRVLNLATELDPAFQMLYTAGGNYLVVARDDRVGALRLVEKGERFLLDRLPTYSTSFREEHWPNSWRIYLIKGYLYLLEFQDGKRAAEAYSHMGDYADAPEAVKIMARNNQTPEGQFNLAANSIKLLRKWQEDNPKMLAELDLKEKYLLTGKDLVIWNRKFREMLAGGRPNLSSFLRFRVTIGIPANDRLGGEIFLNSVGQIDTRTPKVPVLGTDLESALKGVK